MRPVALHGTQVDDPVCSAPTRPGSQRSQAPLAPGVALKWPLGQGTQLEPPDSYLPLGQMAHTSRPLLAQPGRQASQAVLLGSGAVPSSHSTKATEAAVAVTPPRGTTRHED